MYKNQQVTSCRSSWSVLGWHQCALRFINIFSDKLNYCSYLKQLVKRTSPLTSTFTVRQTCSQETVCRALSSRNPRLKSRPDTNLGKLAQLSVSTRQTNWSTPTLNNDCNLGNSKVRPELILGSLFSAGRAGGCSVVKFFRV